MEPTRTLVLPAAVMRRILTQLRDAPPHRAWSLLGLSLGDADGTTLLARDLAANGDTEHTQTGHAHRAGRVLRVELTTSGETAWPIMRDALQDDVVAVLLVGDGPYRGLIWGAVRDGDAYRPIHLLSLVGAGMHRLKLNVPPEQTRPDAAESIFGGDDSALAGPSHNATRLLMARGRWSRTIRALGGEDVWHRLTNLHVAVIGCGRTGSLVAASLARLGTGRLSLIDPDTLEAHALAEMDLVTEDDCGRPKVDAIARHLIAQRRDRRPEGERFDYEPWVTCVRDTVESAYGLQACRQADVLVCCVDQDAARLSTAVLATAYYKVMLDIATGIPVPTAPNDPTVTGPAARVMGADVRLVLPGSRCLLCMGRLRDYQGAVHQLLRGRSVRSGVAAQDDTWRRQRAGSLRTLNQIAAHVGLQMLTDAVSERVVDSLWARVEVDGSGRMAVEYPAPLVAGEDGCQLCARAGFGNDMLALVQSPDLTIR